MPSSHPLRRPRVLGSTRERPALGAHAVLAAASACLLCGCFPLPAHIESSPASFTPSDLSGCWYNVATSFPYWLDGTKSNPEQCYTPRAGHADQLADLVAFDDDGEPDSFAGIDHQDPDQPIHFTWRGEGFLALFPTEFYVAWISPDRETLVVYYSDTLVASAAIDVLTRSPHPDPRRIAKAIAVAHADPFLKTVEAPIVTLPPRKGAPDP
ncbi:MAG TPA: hypothetical protein VL400_10535 [Polyangiaceae bacterium]|nr:hypothetical protein [Polyangiaceae bacterium]